MHITLSVIFFIQCKTPVTFEIFHHRPKVCGHEQKLVLREIRELKYLASILKIFVMTRWLWLEENTAHLNGRK